MFSLFRFFVHLQYALYCVLCTILSVFADAPPLVHIEVFVAVEFPLQIREVPLRLGRTAATAENVDLQTHALEVGVRVILRILLVS